MRDRYASLREGLVGAWIPSVSGSGLLLPDLSGQGNNGTLTNMGPEDWVSSQYGRALDFDGVDDYVMVTNTDVPIGINPASTRSFWVNQRTRINNVNNAIIEQTRTSANESFNVQLATINGTTYFFTDSVNSNNNIVIAGDQIPQLNTWNHIVFSVGKSSDWQYWLNGVLKKSGTFQSTIDLSGTDINIARRTVAVSGYFDGQLDDIRIYNRALSESEIKLLASRPGIGLRPQRRTMYYAPPTGARRRRILTSMP